MSSWVLFAFVVLLDVLSKRYVQAEFPENVVYGSGFFQNPGFLILTIMLFGFLSVKFFGRSRWETAGLALVMSGAVSNLIDKLDDGLVVDFLNSGIAVFNFADLAIWAGIIVLGYNVISKNPK